ncbi:alpha-L-glutamate ligase RimK family [methanogenic archaeon mixed culture ISO4-G1]|nr:alpha-L-glutamate ligase RimK family [methanogenic archaeon mixed culture ISO4-G1]
MQGAIVINGFLDSRKFREPAEMMTDACSRHGIGMRTFRNTDLTVPVGDYDALSERLGDVDFVVFWDKDIGLAKNLEVCGYNVFNCSECIRLCDDKSLTHLTLADYGIPSIRTIVSPMSFGEPYKGWISTLEDQLGFPMVVKDCFGSFGEQVRMVRDEQELRREVSGGKPTIFQPYVECGREDIRIEVVGDRAVAAVRRTAKEGDFRANATNGGTMHRYEPTPEEEALAVDAASALQADFAGVDILRTADGPVVCEVNSNAHIKNLKDCTGIDVSDAITEHIIALIG